MNDLEQQYSPEDLAEKWPGHNRRSIIDAARREKWPCIKIGKRITFTKAQIEQILAEHTVGGQVEVKAELTPTLRSTRRSS